jgi:CBS domain-containing protein
MMCEQIMQRDVKSLSESDTVQAAAQLMRQASIGFLPICDATGKVVGTVTDRDIVLRVVADGGPLSTLLSEVMTRDIVACRPNDDLEKAESLMGEKHKSRIVCCDQSGKLEGVISLSDIAHNDDGEHIARTVREVKSQETHVG